MRPPVSISTTHQPSVSSASPDQATSSLVSEDCVVSLISAESSPVVSSIITSDQDSFQAAPPAVSASIESPTPGVVSPVSSISEDFHVGLVVSSEVPQVIIESEALQVSGSSEVVAAEATTEVPPRSAPEEGQESSSDLPYVASNQVESSSIQESSSVSIISPDHQGYPIKEPLTVSSESINPRLLVLIIDQVDRSKFSSSKDILRFLHSVAPDISVQFAYFLPKGGIAIHLSSVKDRDILSSLLPRDIFVDVKTLSEERVHYVYLKQVNFCISIDDLKSKLSNSIEVFSLARTISKVSGRPTTSIKLATNLKGAEYLLLGGLIVNGSPIAVEKKKSNPVCY